MRVPPFRTPLVGVLGLALAVGFVAGGLSGPAVAQPVESTRTVSGPAPDPAPGTPAAAATPAAPAPTRVTVVLSAPRPQALAAAAQTAQTARTAETSGSSDTGSTQGSSEPAGPADSDAPDDSGNLDGPPADLAGLLPADRQRDRVAAGLRARGLRVVGETQWSITATAPAGTVADVFGTRPGLPADPSAAERRAATGALSRVPMRLRGLIAGAYPTTGGPRAFARDAAASLAGPDFRNASAPAGRVASPNTAAAGLTIATMQLTDLPAADLTTYAGQHGLADPVAAGRYHPITVDGGPRSRDDAGGNGVEAALDQESILSTAPAATQAAYFAPNTAAGYADVFASVLDDVTGDPAATHPDPHIAALSVSWGACEAITGRRSIAALEPIVDSLVAAGVTIFASSGDNGVYDCATQQADVDYPASSPAVVAVGGSRLTTSGRTANTGTNWAETAWSCHDFASCVYYTGGSGGGVSGAADHASVGHRTGDFAGFAEPAYQARTLTRGRDASVQRRLLPDVVADADPATGFRIYSSDPVWRRQHSDGLGVLGGTSLAAPVSAALFTASLGAAGRTTGVGDIHAALYSAAAETSTRSATDARSVLRDVVAGRNGASAQRGTDPSVAATTGYDTVSGLGSVLWAGLTPYLLSTARPVAAVHLAHPAHQPRRRDRARIALRWSTGRGPDPILLDHVALVVRRAGSGAVLARIPARAGRRTFDVARGARVRVSLTVSDLAGRRRSVTRVERAVR